MAWWQSAAPTDDESRSVHSLSVAVTAAESRLEKPIWAAAVADLSSADEILMNPGQVKTA
ncbi:hypothetical protein AB0E10_40325 [Streptomyces sp. NPDC048045]|uniref:hypothetical protein n=1 Tax=Streptomyces sp. NPDC048045 TaxID=3154710 RepID=UPI0034455B7D